jgi:hypothetical protein
MPVRPVPTTDTADMALRMTCVERRIDALAAAILLLLGQATTPAQRRAVELARAELDDVALPHR